MKGYVQVYTGDGKGKTTAALGLLLRAAGSGRRALLVQFLKGRDTGELRVLRKRFPEVTVRTFGRPSFVRGRPSRRDAAAARSALAELRRGVAGGDYDLVIADEANEAATLGLVTVQELLELARGRLPAVELIFTGRRAPRALRREADLVTEMRAAKHYFARGVAARKGIEY